jgi:hypothetical protein
MKNLTLRIDENVLAEARKRAALEGVTVAKAVREFLQQYAAAMGDHPVEGRLKRFRERPPAAPGFAEPTHPYEDQAVMEADANRPLTIEEMTIDTGAPPVPGHDEWFCRQVQKTLDKKKAGNLKYRSLEEVAARFGFNAR